MVARRGHAARRTIRDGVAAIETELEEQLGTTAYCNLRELLVRLNACTIAHGTQAGAAE